MRRHEFEPGALLAGLVFLALAATALLDASGRWQPRWPETIALGASGLALAWVVSLVTGTVRRRRSRALTASAPDRDGGRREQERDG